MATKVPGLDSLRGIAIAYVVAFHFLPGFPGGYVGLDVFFPLSGFLVTTQLGGSLGGFYARRLARLGPALALLLVLFTVVGPHSAPNGVDRGSTRPVAEVLLLGLNLHSYNGDMYFDVPTLLGPLWSLCVEEQFYLLWPWLLVWLGRKSHLLIMIMAAAWLVGTVRLITAAASEGPRGLWSYSSTPSAYFFSEVRVPEILLGAAVAVLIQRGYGLHARRLGACALLGLVLLPFTVGLYPIRWWQFVVLPLMIALLTATLIWIAASAVALPPWKWPLTVLAYLGRRSFFLYLFHVPAKVWIAEGGLGASGSVLALALLLVAAEVFGRWVEEPARGFVRARVAA